MAMAQRGCVVILHGPTSSGKTTVAHRPQGLLERREAVRAALPRHSPHHREAGMARSQSDCVHAFANYGLVIDMTMTSADHAATADCGRMTLRGRTLGV